MPVIAGLAIWIVHDLLSGRFGVRSRQVTAPSSSEPTVTDDRRDAKCRRLLRILLLCDKVGLLVVLVAVAPSLSCFRLDRQGSRIPALARRHCAST